MFEAACQSGWGGKPDVRVIRNLITESEVAVAENSKFRFVGADAFSPDELRTDLFSDDGDGYVDRVALDAALLEKLQAVAEHLREAEGWEWCAGRMEPVGECREDAGTYRCLPEPEAVLTEAEEERLNELMTRYDALENQCEESDLLEAEMKLMRCMAKVEHKRRRCVPEAVWWCPSVTVMCVSSVVCSCAARMTRLTTLTARNRCRRKHQWRKSVCHC